MHEALRQKFAFSGLKDNLERTGENFKKVINTEHAPTYKHHFWKVSLNLN